MIIGLTGGIGSGKSTVSNELKNAGCIVIDADAIYKDLTKPGMPLVKRLADEFGDVITDGELDRKKLSQKALGSKKLNEITHKAISEEIERQIAEHFNQDVFLDLPLLFETGYDKRCDEIWTVTAPESVRLKRVAERDGISFEEIKRRISLQMSDEEKIAKSDVVIVNDGSLEDLIDKVKGLLNGRN